MEGAERTDGAKPELTIRAISDEGQTDNQLKEATLNTYSKFNVIAHGEQSATVANLSTYEVELKFRLKNQPKPELERVTFHAVWFFMRIPSQKKIYTLIWLDRDEDFKEGARVVWGAIQSFKPTH
ncbi:MAG TPA: hypothetical protein VKF81_10650 [Blastocatellia bacterium]|nr:hypothetical protein [Blastocatellia bacterium]